MCRATYIIIKKFSGNGGGGNIFSCLWKYFKLDIRNTRGNETTAISAISNV